MCICYCRDTVARGISLEEKIGHMVEWCAMEFEKRQ